MGQRNLIGSPDRRGNFLGEMCRPVATRPPRAVRTVRLLPAQRAMQTSAFTTARCNKMVKVKKEAYSNLCGNGADGLSPNFSNYSQADATLNT